MRKNENKAYLNGDRLLALWLYEHCNQQVICGCHPFSLYDVILVANTGIHSFFHWIPASRAGMTGFMVSSQCYLIMSSQCPDTGIHFFTEFQRHALK
ncbi:hypothetical protein [Wolbachia endosymbiont of Ctenocephalides felis wCfeJ]|uniref:hypothetical protein n=1 Tax=Wolbachia endosymbiont of Ctenocephalides felis wCfeJ TaxID=2732594 RepID=UPI001445E079|nr:hypothetical protein [Wolbachia endosymbiont of Ctenocephalides felis wCfeJ]